MKVLLNGHELPRQATGNATLGDVLTELQRDTATGGMIITETLVDGKPLPNGWQRRKLLGAGVSGFQQLELRIEESLNLKMQTLLDARQLAGRLLEQTKPLSRKFRLGDEVTANNELASFLDDLKLILAGLDHSTRGDGSNRALTPVREHLVSSANSMLPTLDRIYKAQANGDYIAVADEIEYDLRDQIAGWPNLLEEARQGLQPPGQVR